ncbi:MAG: cupin domain-containing protein [Umezawaea sp.]
MASTGDVLEHPVTGERLVWRLLAADTGGELLQADLYARPGGAVAAEHVHPHQQERFEVVSGTLRIRIDGREQTLTTGSVAVVPPGSRHVWWNAGEDEVHVIGDLRPALRSELFFQTFFGLAAEGKVNKLGLPNLLQLAVLMHDFAPEIVLARPPVAVQRPLFAILALLGKAFGYRSTYPQHDPGAQRP